MSRKALSTSRAVADALRPGCDKLQIRYGQPAFVRAGDASLLVDCVAREAGAVEHVLTISVRYPPGPEVEGIAWVLQDERGQEVTGGVTNPRGQALLPISQPAKGASLAVYRLRLASNRRPHVIPLSTWPRATAAAGGVTSAPVEEAAGAWKATFSDEQKTLVADVEIAASEAPSPMAVWRFLEPTRPPERPAEEGVVLLQMNENRTLRRGRIQLALPKIEPELLAQCKLELELITGANRDLLKAGQLGELIKRAEDDGRADLALELKKLEEGS